MFFFWEPPAPLDTSHQALLPRMPLRLRKRLLSSRNAAQQIRRMEPGAAEEKLLKGWFGFWFGYVWFGFWFLVFGWMFLVCFGFWFGSWHGFWFCLVLGLLFDELLVDLLQKADEKCGKS